MAKFFMEKDGKMLGPSTPEELLAQGLTRSTPVWTQGMEDWLPACQVRGVVGAVGVLPPETAAVTPPHRPRDPANSHAAQAQATAPSREDSAGSASSETSGVPTPSLQMPSPSRKRRERPGLHSGFFRFWGYWLPRMVLGLLVFWTLVFLAFDYLGRRARSRDDGAGARFFGPDGERIYLEEVSGKPRVPVGDRPAEPVDVPRSKVLPNATYRGTAKVIATGSLDGDGFRPDNPTGYKTGQWIEVRVLSKTLQTSEGSRVWKRGETFRTSSYGGDVGIAGKPGVGDEVHCYSGNYAVVFEREVSAETPR